jgi:hypothetical protein
VSSLLSCTYLPTSVIASRFLRELYGALRWRGDSIVGAMETERIAHATQSAAWHKSSLMVGRHRPQFCQNGTRLRNSSAVSLAQVSLVRIRIRSYTLSPTPTANSVLRADVSRNSSVLSVGGMNQGKAHHLSKTKIY